MLEKIRELTHLTHAQMKYLTTKGLIISVIFIGAYFLVSALKHAILGSNKKILTLDKALVPVVTGIISGLIYSIAVFTSLDILGIVSKTTIVTVLGSLGLGAGFAMKDLVSNTIAGIILLMTHPFNAGDFIDCNGGSQRVSGTVQIVSVLTTKLETVDGVCIFIPNQLVWASPIINYSRNDIRRLVCPLQISRTANIDDALQALNEVIDNEPRFLADPAPLVIVTSIEETLVKIELRAWTNTSTYWDTVYDVTKNVKKVAEARGLTHPTAQHIIQIQPNAQNAVNATNP